MKKIIIFLLFLCFFMYRQNGFAQPDWNMNTTDYQYSMTATGVIILNSQESSDQNDIVGAFVDGECRGTAQPVYISSIDRYIVFMMIYSNVASGETLQFEIYDADQDMEHDLDFAIDFSANQTLGKPGDPVIFSAPALSSEAGLFSFSISGQVGETLIDSEKRTVSVEVPYDMDISNLVPEFDISPKANVSILEVPQISGTTANDFRQPVIYTIISENGFIVSDWQVIIEKQQAEGSAVITAITAAQEITAPSIDYDLHRVTIQVPVGTDVTSMVLDFEVSEGAVATVNGVAQESGVTANNFAEPVVYEIAAQDGTKMQWTVVVETINNESEIISYAVSEQNKAAIINQTNHTITVQVPADTDLTQLTAFFSLSDKAKAYIQSIQQVSGITLNNFSEPVIYQIVAQDGSQQEWTVEVLVASQITEVAHVRKMLVFPNPVGQTLYLKNMNPEKCPYEVTIYNSNGKEVFRKIVTGLEVHTIPVGNLTEGIYWVTIRNQTYMQTEKIIVR